MRCCPPMLLPFRLHPPRAREGKVQATQSLAPRPTAVERVRAKRPARRLLTRGQASPSMPWWPALHTSRHRHSCSLLRVMPEKRRRALPAPVEPKIHSDEEGPLDIPPTVDTAKLVCVLEFFSTFAGTIGLEDLSVSALAKELVREDEKQLEGSLQVGAAS